MRLRSFSPEPDPLSYLGSPQGRDIYLGEPTSTLRFDSLKSGLSRAGSRSTINAGVAASVIRLQESNGPVSYIVSPEAGKLLLAEPTAIIKVERDPHGTISPKLLRSQVYPQDRSSGFFIQNQSEWFVVVADTGIGEDELIDAVTRMVVADTGTGYDEALGLVSYVLSDAGVGIDRASIAARFGTSDTGVGNDSSIPAPQERVLDAGVGADLASGWLASPASDTGVGTDTTSVSYLLLGIGAHLAAGQDAANQAVAQVVFDAAAGFDVTTSIPLQIVSDRGVGADMVTQEAGLPAIDFGLGTDTSWLSYVVEPSAADLAAAVDAATAGFTPTPETTQQVLAVGTTQVPIRVWSRFIDIVLVGGGNGGGGGWAGGIVGGGGNPGIWASITLERGVHIPWTTTVVSITIPAAVAGGTSGNKAAGGGTVSASATGWSDGLSAAGGTSDLFGTTRVGASAGSHTRNGKSYNGGAAQNTNGATGNPPGGGGNGGNGGVFSGSQGGAGAPGGGWVRCYQ